MRKRSIKIAITLSILFITFTIVNIKAITINSNNDLGITYSIDVNSLMFDKTNIKKNLFNSPELNGNILYKMYNKNTGWDDKWSIINNYANAINRDNIRLIKIKLNKNVNKKYDIYYRCYSSKFGWLDWAVNGQISGTTYYDIKKIEIKLCLKVDYKKNTLNTSNNYINNKMYIPVYYNQKDKRWKNIKYGFSTMGSSGCTPTSLAMAYTSILNKIVTPVEVADYLYYETNEYNNDYVGSSGLAVIYASKKYGIKYTPLKTKKELENALIRGKIVYAAMGSGKYATTKYNHAIILYGYNFGYTISNDPLKKINNDYVSINQIWEEQSKDFEDSIGGSNFYSLEEYL